MNNTEFLEVAATLRAAFPSNNFLTTKDSIQVWNELLKDLDFNICKAAAIEYISTNKFPPSISEIREKCTALTYLPISDWSEAWENVLRSIRRYGYMQESEALGTLDDITKKCVKRLGYQNICMSENITADRANFRMIYEQEAQRKKSENQLPILLQTQKRQMLEQLIENTTVQIEKHEEPVKEIKSADMEQVTQLIDEFRR